jgi:hypothetical protein
MNLSTQSNSKRFFRKRFILLQSSWHVIPFVVHPFPLHLTTFNIPLLSIFDSSFSVCRFTYRLSFIQSFILSLIIVEEDNAGYSCLELCRTYAGVEDLFYDTPEDLLPCFSALVTASFFCPKYLREWLWYKLAHLETLTAYTCEPVKKRLSVYWDMPELVIDGFAGWKADPPE